MVQTLSNRLTSATYSTGEQFDYAYDAVGNRTAMTTTAGAKLSLAACRRSSRSQYGPCFDRLNTSRAYWAGKPRNSCPQSVPLFSAPAR